MLGDLLAWFTKKPAIGLDTSGGGLCVLTQEPVGRDEFEVRATLETRLIRVRAKSVCAADDWDAIIRYTTDKPIAEDNKAQEELVTVN